MTRSYDNWERLVAATLDRENLRSLAMAPSIPTSADTSFRSLNSAPSETFLPSVEGRSFDKPIQLAYSAIRAADEATSYKTECLKLKSDAQKLAGLLHQAACVNNQLYDCRIIHHTEDALDKAVTLLLKCQGWKRLFTNVQPVAFEQISLQLSNSISNISSTVIPKKQEGSHNNHHETRENRKNQQQKPSQQIIKNSSKRPSGVIPCGKRTDFGYDKDFRKRYTIGKLLGHGQFGYTYVAIDKSNGDRVAVKKIDKRKMVLPIAVEDVKREVKILRALAGRENVVHFYNAFEDDNYVYIVMELCEGGELLDRILSKKDSRYREKDAAIVVRQMLKVAAECHLHGFVHRDMKPENFLFKSTKEDSPLKATGFGLSDFIRPGKKFQDIVGSAYYVAPEVLKRKSGPESDVWSIGVITYILLCGRRPFWDKTEDGIFKEVLRNKPDFRRKPWPGISNPAKDFVKKLLVKNPPARLTAAQALSHPWVREGGEASEIPLDISVLSNMRQFAKYSRFKQFALRALARTLDEEELADLRYQFDAIDVDKNGVISLEEMRQALEKDLPWKMKDSRVLEILQAMDSNTDGLVDFSEFVAATLHVHQLEEHNSEKWQQRSQAAFQKFDVDRDGFITPEELKMHTGLRGSIDPLLEEADIDKDGRISLSEFRRLLRTASMSSRGITSPSANRAAQKIFQ